MQISFYVLGDRYLPDDNDANARTDSAAPVDSVLNFVCKLTQTVLKKSAHSLVIVDDNIERLRQLDKQLWQFDPTSFVPHTLILPSSDNAHRSDDNSVTSDEHHPVADQTANESEAVDVDSLTAPVSLLTTLPKRFDGVVLNLAAVPLALATCDSLSNGAASSTSDRALPERILEIITPDDTGKQQGRDKYKTYRDQGHELTYFPID